MERFTETLRICMSIAMMNVRMYTNPMFYHRAFKRWQSMGKQVCVECGTPLTRHRATRSLFCEDCFDERMGYK